VVAGMLGLGVADPGLWLCTGVGDAVGVGLGHFGYYCIKKQFSKDDIDLVQEGHTAVLVSAH
jgi:hypothetical protein